MAKILSNSDYSRLLAEIKNPKHRLLIQIARYTGEKWISVCRLRVCEVYSIPVRNTPAPYITFGARRFLVCNQLKEELKAYALPLNSEWLFFSRLDFSRPMTVKCANQFFQSALCRAGLEGFTTYSTRQTFAENLLQHGVSIFTVLELTGLKDLRSLLQHTTKATEEEIFSALESL